MNDLQPNLPAFDPLDVPARTGSSYPAPYKAVSEARLKRKLGDAMGLKKFGVNLVHLPPGAGSAHRHWHTRQDEFIYVLEGELVLISDAGEQVLNAGMAAGFPAGVADGHQLVNKSGKPATYLEIGDRSGGDEVDYPDIDMALRIVDGALCFVTKAGKPL